MAALNLDELRALRARSWLFVPATQPQRFAKAAASGCDRVIIDLEDAVAPEAKAEARRQLAALRLPGDVPFYLRVNGQESQWFEADLALAATLPLAGVMLPKAERPEQLAAVATALPPALAIIALVETAAGLWHARELASSPRVERLAFGAVDFQVDTGMQCGPDAEPELDYARSRVVIASRVARIAAPIDSPLLNMDAIAQLDEHARRSRRFGFAGKLCIHPKQIEAVHRAYQPTAAEVTWAHGLLEALAQMSQEERGVFSYQGTMIDKPVIAKAKAILDYVPGT